ncbi:heterokaryon incompatibility protein-domain-containing protein [Halenospora varia]|nr:heterokaryon incompatibility protein-domain-containing protein [Halenospora varia]
MALKPNSVAFATTLWYKFIGACNALHAACLRLLVQNGAFRYSGLNHNANEIRLLRIQPSAGALNSLTLLGFPIRCEIFKVNLDDNPSYNALSYTWGLPTSPNYPILLNGRKFLAGENLWLALYQLQKSDEPVIIWIDAICIDQENVPERDHQVTKMKAIYEQAKNVLVWLGPSYHQSKLAFQMVHEIHGHQHEDDWIAQRLQLPDMPICLKALGNLFARQYWFRIWIVQELTVAKRITIQCGNDSVDGDVLLRVQEMLVDKDNITNLFGMLIPDDLSTQSSLKVRGMSEVQAWRDDFLIKDLTLFHWALYHFSRQSTDPKDKLYGLLGLASTLGNPSIQVDYSLPTAEIYKQFARNETQSSKQLHMLCQVRLHLKTIDIPSWVPDWSLTNPNHFFLQSVLETNFNFTASGETDSEIAFSTDGNSLITKGVKLSTIERFGEPSSPNEGLDLKTAADVFFENWQFICTLSGEQLLNQEAFARTLLCGKILEDRIGNNSMSGFLQKILGGFAELLMEMYPTRVLDQVLVDCANFIHIEERRSAQAKNEPYDATAQSIIWRAWVQISVAITWDRRFFVSSGGTMGMAPESALEGDTICIPLGCPHPMILRHVDDHYVVVGEAYVDGYMYGNAMELLEQGKLQLQDFELH